MTDNVDRYNASEAAQWIVTGPDGTELLISFWGGKDSDPEVAPRIDHTRWGMPLPTRRVGC